MVRQWTVTPSVAGSIPVVRPENDMIFHVFRNVCGVLSSINDFFLKNEADGKLNAFLFLNPKIEFIIPFFIL